MSKPFPALRAACCAALLALCAGCPGKPSQEECEKFADKFVSLVLAGDGEEQDEVTKDIGAEMRTELVDSCVKEGTKKEVDCVLAAASMEEVEKNCK